MIPEGQSKALIQPDNRKKLRLLQFGELIAEALQQSVFGIYVKAATPKAYEEVLREINERDYQDMHRDIAPLREAADAVHFDTSKLSFEESEQALLSLIQEKLK